MMNSKQNQSSSCALVEGIPELEAVVAEEVSFDSVGRRISAETAFGQLLREIHVAHLQITELVGEGLHAVVHAWWMKMRHSS